MRGGTRGEENIRNALILMVGMIIIAAIFGAEAIYCLTVPDKVDTTYSVEVIPGQFREKIDDFSIKLNSLEYTLDEEEGGGSFVFTPDRSGITEPRALFLSAPYEIDSFYIEDESLVIVWVQDKKSTGVLWGLVLLLIIGAAQMLKIIIKKMREPKASRYDLTGGGLYPK